MHNDGGVYFPVRGSHEGLLVQNSEYTDDVLLFVQAALGHPHPAMRPASTVAGSVIEDANAWREVVVTEITPGQSPNPSPVKAD